MVAGWSFRDLANSSAVKTGSSIVFGACIVFRIRRHQGGRSSGKIGKKTGKSGKTGEGKRKL
jgi:hypothetical protein